MYLTPEQEELGRRTFLKAQEAMHSARACIRANEAIQKKTRLDV